MELARQIIIILCDFFIVFVSFCKVKFNNLNNEKGQEKVCGAKFELPKIYVTFVY